jgi:hypothetical protein
VADISVTVLFRLQEPFISTFPHQDSVRVSSFEIEIEAEPVLKYMFGTILKRLGQAYIKIIKFPVT